MQFELAKSTYWSKRFPNTAAKQRAAIERSRITRSAFDKKRALELEQKRRAKLDVLREYQKMCPQALKQIKALQCLLAEKREIEARETKVKEAGDKEKLPFKDILEAAKIAFQTEPLSQIFSESRKRPLARARQIIMFVARRETSLSLTVIGRLMGGLDHSTILHGVRKIESLIETGESETKNKAALLASIAKKIAGKRTVGQEPIQ